MSVYRITENQVSAVLQNSVVILHTGEGEYYGLDDVGAFIWEILQNQPATLNELKTSVMKAFEVDEATCTNDIKVFLNQLLEEKLIIRESM